MPQKRIDRVGNRYARLIVKQQWLKPRKDGSNRSVCLCLCDCGFFCEIPAQSLVSGNTRSCGCIHKEELIARITTHGLSDSKTYQAWADMLNRCKNPGNPWFHNYGGRGISVCKKWRDSFEAFFKDVGIIPPGKELDRINNSGNYEPGNIRVTTRVINDMNTRRSKWWFIRGKRFVSSVKAAEVLGVHPMVVRVWCDGRRRNGKFYPGRSDCYSVLKYPKEEVGE